MGAAVLRVGCGPENYLSFLRPMVASASRHAALSLQTPAVTSTSGVTACASREERKLAVTCQNK
jgi:hypothetical protein